MNKRRWMKQVAEYLILALVPVALNLLYPHDPGFLLWKGLPYLATALLMTAFSGLGWGFAQLVLSLTLGLAVMPALEGGFAPAFSARAVAELQFSLPITLVAWLGLGFVHNRSADLKRRFLQRLKRAVRKVSVLSRKASSLQRVNQVLEDRIVNQKDSITMLRSQVKKMASLNLAQALETLLETVRLFTQMTSGSVWALNPETKKLTAVSVLGWESEERRWEADPDQSIVGYVYRNGKPFSIRMVLRRQEFTGLDLASSLLTYPIRVRGRVWGVLNIETLPFERYSLYTESVLEIILSLVEPSLADAIDHEVVFKVTETDPVTGLPLVTQLFRTLEQELERSGRDSTPLSLVLIEITNFADLEKTWPRAALKRLFVDIVHGLDTSQQRKSRAFHFKSDNQIAVLLTGLDQDGTSYLCLELLSLVPQLGLAIDGAPVPLELIVGFSSVHDSSRSSEAILEGAETLLSLQRLG